MRNHGENGIYFFMALRKAGLSSRGAVAAQGGNVGCQFFLLLLSFDCPKESNKKKATAYEKFGVITTEVCPPASQAGRNDAIR
jgi:hypothetical protein